MTRVPELHGFGFSAELLVELDKLTLFGVAFGNSYECSEQVFAVPALLMALFQTRCSLRRREHPQVFYSPSFSGRLFGGSRFLCFSYSTLTLFFIKPLTLKTLPLCGFPCAIFFLLRATLLNLEKSASCLEFGDCILATNTADRVWSALRKTFIGFRNQRLATCEGVASSLQFVRELVRWKAGYLDGAAGHEHEHELRQKGHSQWPLDSECEHAAS
jgi:hypothetical protein